MNRILEPLPTVKTPKIPCVVCGGRTNKGKPWCLTHIERSPYVRGIRAAERQLARDIKAKRLRLGSMLVQEAYAVVAGSENVTAGRVARMLGCKVEVAARALAVLVRAKRLTASPLPCRIPHYKAA